MLGNSGRKNNGRFIDCEHRRITDFCFSPERNEKWKYVFFANLACLLPFNLTPQNGHSFLLIFLKPSLCKIAMLFISSYLLTALLLRSFPHNVPS